MKKLFLFSFVIFTKLAVSQNTIADTLTKVQKINLGKNVNSVYDELCPIITASGKTLYYGRYYDPKNFSDYDAWYSKLDNNGKWGPAIHAENPINTSSGGSVFNVSTDENQLLIRGAWEDGEYKGAGVSVTTLNAKGKWGDPQMLDIKNFKKYSDLGQYSTTFLSSDGKTLLLSFSEKDKGEISDIYYSQLIQKEKWKKPKSFKDLTKFVSKAMNNNSWTEPKKLGPVINGKETSEFGQFLAADGVTLYFSSNRAGSIGSNDIWMSKRLDDTWENWSEPVNLGPTINTTEWEAYYVLDAKGEDAYMVSEKDSYGKSDIVKIKLSKEIRPNPVILISGKVYNAKTKQPIGANIEYENLVDGKNAGVAISNSSTGEYKIVLPYGKNYGFMGFAEKFIPVSDNIDLTAVAEYKEIVRDLYLVPLEVGSTIRLNNIFFDFGKATLRSESFPEMDRLVGLMNENANMEIELSGHTDNVGSDEANLKLSDDRAKAVTDYIVSKGIKPERIKSKGYGETKPVASNDNEEGKQLNRRVEFTILKN